MKTVFITGAGASMPFGFPLGAQLPDKFAQIIKQSEVKERLKSTHFTENEVNEFREILTYGRYKTIDQLLEAKARLRGIGGYLIAEAILSCEVHEHLFRIKDWHEPLYQLLYTQFINKSTNEFAFITLNYDRSLEYFFNKVAKYECHEKHEENLKTYLTNIPIIHAHGSIGNLSTIPYGLKGANKTWQKIVESGNNIKIISDDMTESPSFQGAKETLKDADRVVFLGFGYHPHTVKSLFEDINTKTIDIHGTALNLNVTQIEEIKKLISPSINLLVGGALALVKGLKFE